MYEYKCKIVEVIDGDTVDVDIDLGFGVWLQGQRVRLYGIDAPKNKSSAKLEKAHGILAQQRLQEFMPVGSEQILKTYIDKQGKDVKEKFGRILGEFKCPKTGDTLNVRLVLEGLAVKYFGGNKADLEEAHMLNRTRLLHEGKLVQ